LEGELALAFAWYIEYIEKLCEGKLLSPEKYHHSHNVETCIRGSGLIFE